MDSKNNKTKIKQQKFKSKQNKSKIKIMVIREYRKLFKNYKAE